MLQSRSSLLHFNAFFSKNCIKNYKYIMSAQYLAAVCLTTKFMTVLQPQPRSEFVFDFPSNSGSCSYTTVSTKKRNQIKNVLPKQLL